MSDSYFTFSQKNIDKLRRLVNGEHGDLIYYRKKLFDWFEVSYKDPSSVKKLFDKVGIKSYPAAIEKNGEIENIYIWLYIDPKDTQSKKDNIPSDDIRIRNLISGKPVQLTQQIISIPTKMNCEKRLCQLLKKKYKFPDITYIPSYQSACIICNNGETLSKISDDLKALSKK